MQRKGTGTRGQRPTSSNESIQGSAACYSNLSLFLTLLYGVLHQCCLCLHPSRHHASSTTPLSTLSSGTLRLCALAPIFSSSFHFCYFSLIIAFSSSLLSASLLPDLSASLTSFSDLELDTNLVNLILFLTYNFPGVLPLSPDVVHSLCRSRSRSSAFDSRPYQQN